MNPTIQVFNPSKAEFLNFNKYINTMEANNAHKCGIAKIIPPVEWKPRSSGYNSRDIENINIPHPILQNVIKGTVGHSYKLLNTLSKPIKVKDFKKMAKVNNLESYLTFDEIKRRYWSNLTYSPPLYGADVPGSICDEGLKIWNINKLGSILDLIVQDYNVTISGVNTSYLYFGMWKSSFAWHTEDMDLYSINYLHHGDPKTWYAIPPSHGFRFEEVAKGLFSDDARKCSAFLRHKSSVISPQELRYNAIPYDTITQEKGEIIITFPFGYHAGFNHGFNIAESTNFAMPRWVEYGKRSKQCLCRSDVVKINMDTFVKKFQPEKYENWRKGVDLGFHPENPSRKCFAPKPPPATGPDGEEDSSNPRHKKSKRK